MRVLILGAGGHGRTVADAVISRRNAGFADRAIGFLDDQIAPVDNHHVGLPVLAPLSARYEYRSARLLIAFGDNALRRAWYERLLEERFSLASVVHPSAIIGGEVVIGDGVYLGALAIVGACSRIGPNTIINGGGTVGHHNDISAHAHLGPGVQSVRDVRVGEGAVIGAGTILKPNTAVGAWATVGAGSVVEANLPARMTAVGAPARPIRERSASPAEGH